MLKRPRPGEDEEDILRMQEEFLNEKNKNLNLQPAAQVINLRATESQSTNKSSANESGTRKPSKYAQSKGLKNHSEKRSRIEASTSAVVGDILEKNVEEPPIEKRLEDEDDKVYYPRAKALVLGDIVEKNFDNFIDYNIKPMPSQGFPMATKRDLSIVPGNKSIHAQHFEKLRQSDKSIQMDIEEPSCSNIIEVNESVESTVNLPTKSYILSSKEADVIHSENNKFLSKMSEKQILQEQQKLLSNLDPKLIEFIKSKRLQISNDNKQHSNVSTNVDNNLQRMETSESSVEFRVSEYDALWENDVLSHPDVDKWLHFDSLEKDRLEWMKAIEENKKVETDKPYEARFDFKGYLLPYTMEYTEKTKTLFHHGEEPHRPGYTLIELFELSRSTIIQQRVMALNTIAGILEYYSAGIYKDIIEIPLSKIFFLIRIALDENKVIILESSLKAMRNLLYNRIDEACLDALLGFQEGNQQPCMENDTSEIDELESQESEMKDFHLAEIDIISALLRTDILQRIYYILEHIKPHFNCVQYSLQILIRLSRDSVETASKIVQSDHLMETIIKNFVPTTSINFRFEPQIVYNGKPILFALKLLRVLCLQSKEISDMLISKFYILTPMSEYISSGVDGTYGLRIQIEAFCVMSNLLNYNIRIQNFTSLLPIVVTTLYKHVQGTDVAINSSQLSAAHAGVVLQFVNKLLNCNISNLDTYKSQIYPLIKDGAQKWLAQISQSQSYTCGHLRIVSSVLDCCVTILSVEGIKIQFINDSLKKLVMSQGFNEIVKHIVPCSNLLSGIETKDLHLTKNLRSLGGSVIDSAQKVLPILNIVSPIPFLATLFKLLDTVNDNEISHFFVEKLSEYLTKLARELPSLCDNWFTRIETDLVFNILKITTKANVSESKKDLLYAIANKLCHVLRIDKKYELDFLFNNIVFNKHWFIAARLFNLISLSDADGFSKALTSIEDIKLCYSKVINLNYLDTGPNIILRKWQEPILPRDWIYLPILNLYSKSQDPGQIPKVIGEHASKVVIQITAEKHFIVSCNLEWILFNELCFPDLLKDIDITDRFCRLMCVFLCDNSLFLDPKIKILLQNCIQTLFKKEKKKPFDFDKELTGLNNFQDFYTQFLEQFQSVSYGDHNFAACVLVPLAQKHNIKWRKLLWSEYAGCLRALDCSEELLCYEMKDYLSPEETDESLIKSYFQALSSNLLRPDTVAYRIAYHHTENFKKRLNS